MQMTKQTIKLKKNIIKNVPTKYRNMEIIMIKVKVILDKYFQKTKKNKEYFENDIFCKD